MLPLQSLSKSLKEEYIHHCWILQMENCACEGQRLCKARKFKAAPHSNAIVERRAAT